MSTLSQFTGGGSSTPMGSLTSQYQSTTTPLLDTPQGVFIKTGVSLGGVADSTLTKVRNANMGYNVPYSAVSLKCITATDLGVGIAYGGGVYLRTAKQSLLRSADGVTWTTVALPSLRSTSYGILAAPVYYAGKWLIVVVQSATTTNVVNILTSTDGLTWAVSGTLQYAGGTGIFVSVANSKLYIAVSSFYSGAYQAEIYVSTDGSTFQSCVVPTGTTYITRVVWSGSVYFAAGTNTSAGLISTDGITWTAQSHGGAAATLFFVNNLFIISNGAGNIQTSPASGTTWTARTNPQAATIISIVFAAGLYVAGTTAGVMTSPDGFTWTSRTAGTNANIIFDGTAFLAAGSGTLFRSTDGITWTSQTIPYTTACTSLSSARIIYDGSTRWIIDGAGSIQKSTDGTTWTAALSCNAATVAGTTIAMKLVNGFIFYLPTNGGIQATPSSTGTDWSIKFNSTVVFNDITFGNGLYVAVGVSGAVYTSTDLATWTTRSAGATTHNVVCFGNSMFVSAGAYSGAYSSPDGITWTLRSSMATTAVKFATYKNGRFILAGGTFYNSADGITWVSLGISSQIYTRAVGDAVISYGNAGSGIYIFVGGKYITFGGSGSFNAVGYYAPSDTYYVFNSGGDLYAFVGLNALVSTAATWLGSTGGSQAASGGIYGNITPLVFAETPGIPAMMAIGQYGSALSINGGYFFSNSVFAFNTGYLTQASTVISTADYMIVSDSSSLYYYKRDGITSNADGTASSTPIGSPTTTGYTVFYRRVG